MKQAPHIIENSTVKAASMEMSRECSVYLSRTPISTSVQEGVIQKLNGHDALPFLPTDKLKDLTSRVYNGESGAHEADVPVDSQETQGVETPPNTTPTKNGSPEIKLKITKTYMNGKPLFESSICGEQGEETAKPEENESKNKKERKRKSIKFDSSEEKSSDGTQADAPAESSEEKSVSDLDTSVEQKEQNEIPCKFSVGDLVWSKVSGYPWWPCIVTSDPVLHSHTKIKGQKKSFRQYHVQFFGNAPERAWIFEKSIVPYTGEQEYEQLCQESAKQATSKAEKVKLLKPITGKLKTQWDIGMEQVKEALQMTVEGRKDKFTFIYIKDRPHLNPKVVGKAAVPAESCNDDDSDEPPESPKKDGVPSKRRRVSRNSSASCQETDPDWKTTTESPDAKGAMSLPIQKRKSGAHNARGRKGDAATQFLVFCQKHKDEVISEHPDASSEEIEELLESQWNMLSDKQKARYNTKFAILTSPKSEEDSGSTPKDEGENKRNIFQESPKRRSRSRSN
ncbi:unnamed protein product [Staurois parvus]|uniref:Histone-lysine N-methyltransferase NSD2 n=1 Tax=Staurois parvus TaxID=386267 RepID=A0ABN9EMJ2_9NEOB|nr:unnamed protein product [Staurois parvus]